MMTTLHKPALGPSASRMMTSVPWPADRRDVPSIAGVPTQAISLFDPAIPPRLRRYLLLAESGTALPERLVIVGAVGRPCEEEFSDVTVRTVRESPDDSPYVYRECEARVRVGNREIGLCLGLLPSTHRSGDVAGEHVSRWQWCAAERVWSGRLAEAWRVGGHLVPYTLDACGAWKKTDLLHLGTALEQHCGDILHGDVFLVIWKSGLVQLTTHFKSCYFHAWPKAVSAFPIVQISELDGQWRRTAILPGQLLHHGSKAQRPRDCLDFRPCSQMFSAEYPGRVAAVERGVVIQPWQDLRILVNKTADNVNHYLEPAEAGMLPPGVSRSFWFHLGLDGTSTDVARYGVEPAWYARCGQIMCGRVGAGAKLASRSVELIRAHTQRGGIDTGRVWRYLRRDLRTGIPEEDGAEWEGNLAQAMFTFAYQTGESPEVSWETFLHHAYHAADIAVYHGAWMGRLECSVAFSAPLPKFRFGGMVQAYLETGDPYLLEIARSLAGVYMAMESALQPRSAIGRDAYPVTSLLHLWDYTAEPLYLEFSRQTAHRLLRSQQPDGGFGGQAGAGTFAGISAKPGEHDVHFGSGVLAPIVLVEWLARDPQALTKDVLERLQRWVDLMIDQQADDGAWHRHGQPYLLTGAVAAYTLSAAGQILQDPRCLDAVRRLLTASAARGWFVSGTHSFLPVLYAHAVDHWTAGTGAPATPRATAAPALLNIP